MLHLGNLHFGAPSDADVEAGPQPEDFDASESRMAGAAHATAQAQALEMEACRRLLGLPELQSIIWDEPLAPAAQQPTGALRRSSARAAEARDCLMEELHGALLGMVGGKLVDLLNEGTASGLDPHALSAPSNTPAHTPAHTSAHTPAHPAAAISGPLAGCLQLRVCALPLPQYSQGITRPEPPPLPRRVLCFPCSLRLRASR